MHQPLVLKYISNLSTVLIALLACVAVTPGQAQSRIMNVDVPFGFESGTNHFAAGVYTIHLDNNGPIIRIEGQHSSAFQMTVPDSAVHPPEHGKLVFNRYGSQYILKEVWVAGSTSYLRTPKSKVEQELKLALATGNPQGSVALVATGR